MHHAYLVVETHSDRPEMVRLYLAEHARPPEGRDLRQPRIRYIAHFNDGDAARMHAHEYLKRRLVDLDAGLYRVSLTRAIAAVEAIDLRHRPVYTDPVLDEDSLLAIEQARLTLSARDKRRRRFFETMGYIGIGLLLFNLFVISLG